MTRKDFILLANLFADLIDNDIISIDKTNQLSKILDYNLKKSNPNFNIDKFNNAITDRLNKINSYFEPGPEDTHEDLFGF